MKAAADAEAPAQDASAHGPRRPKRMLAIGLAGTAITLVCCFTPVLVIALAAVGLAAWAFVLDAILFPVLAVFVGMVGYALFTMLRKP